MVSYLALVDGKFHLVHRISCDNRTVLCSICPGRHFADANIFMAIASIVATLNITKARDSSGSIIEPSTTFDTGLGR